MWNLVRGVIVNIDKNFFGIHFYGVCGVFIAMQCRKLEKEL